MAGNKYLAFRSNERMAGKYIYSTMKTEDTEALAFETTWEFSESLIE